ncbi:dTDP-4-dehydrorhamnose reductase [hydrothermal vent metagenome]|uniref:dTDP-4-dehydrorhamnose reductase n=1 Tax=hydrothermal vent metagenome TaxID=652676 RepID=A0A3B1CF54_9ZZZZ
MKADRRKKILVIGAGGNLGFCLARFLSGKYEVHSTVHNYCPEGLNAQRLDITNRGAVEAMFDKIKPDAAVNLSALADANVCEKKPDKARLVNVDGAENVARACRRSGDIYLVHYSTDLVFDGTCGPYSEDDAVNPVNVYGATKAESESAVISSHENSAILRTAIVYGRGSGKRPNFFEFLIAQAQSGNGAKIFNNEYRSFLYADDSANAVAELIDSSLTGVFHAGGDERLNRYEFVTKMLFYFGLPGDNFEPIRIGDLAEQAPRPPDCSLNSAKLKSKTGWRPSSFEQGMERFKQSLGL